MLAAWHTRASCFKFVVTQNPSPKKFGGYVWRGVQVYEFLLFKLAVRLKLCLSCFTEGDFATLSQDREQVIRRGSEIRAEMSYQEGISFEHVLRILNIIHEVSPNYFLIGVSAHV